MDIANVDRDMALARHVTLVHQNEGLEKSTDVGNDNADSDDEDDEDGDNAAAEGPTATPVEEDDGKGPVSPRVLREYICRARRHQPVVPPDVAPYIVEAYVSLRLQEKRTSNDQTAMTARQLLSILRLSQALARLRFSDLVARQDVDEAIRLTHMSKASLEDPTGAGNGGKDGVPREDVTSRIFQVLREYSAASGNDQEVDLRTAEAMALRKGFTNQQFQTCLEEYEALRVIQINQSRTAIYFL
uniref:MCM AAA-lid domain-containing protein n=1 Tax=Entomoneis paludosa TaxID=265537 RepID=A0A6U3B2F3_9STRA